MDFFKKFEQKANNQITEIQKQALSSIATLELLREVKEGVEKLHLKVAELEKRIDERIPEKALSEKTFKEEIDFDDFAEKLAAKVKSIARPIIASPEQLGIVESRRIQRIVSILQDHGKLSSSQLGKILELSRTRTNEYLKKMEKFGIVEGINIGKEKYYRLRD